MLGTYDIITGEEDYQPVMLFAVQPGWLQPAWYGYSNVKLRPVVCLPSNVNATKSGAVWNIEN